MNKLFKLVGIGLLALGLATPVMAASVTINGGISTAVPVPVSMAATPTGAATAAKQPALGTAGSASTDVITVQGITGGTPQPTSPTPYAAGATPLTASSADVAAASAVATLAGASSKTTYITGFTCTSTGSTGAGTVLIALSGTITGTMNYIYASVAGATLSNPQLSVQFNTAIPASGTNTAIVVTMPSLGVGNLHAACNSTGFQL